MHNSCGKVNFFKAYRNPTKRFLQILFLYMKMTTKYYRKNKEKLQKETHVKGIKIFLNKKNKGLSSTKEITTHNNT